MTVTNSISIPALDAIQPQSDNIRQFVKHLKTLYKYDEPKRVENERRAADRFNITIPVLVTPIRDDLTPRPLELQGMTRDISETGVGFVLNNPVDGNYLLLEFEPYDQRPLSLIAKFIYCEEDGFYFRIGCEFVL